MYADDHLTNPFQRRRQLTTGSVDLGGILRRSDPLGRIYGWIPLCDLLGSVTRVPYLQGLYMERNTETLKLARIVLKRLQTP